MPPLFIAISIVIVLAGAYLLNWYIRLLTQRPRYKRYWDTLAIAPIPKDAIKIVALGDSLMQGMGADQPEDGLLGRIINHIRQKTGRSVAVLNLSRVGAKVADVVAEQLPHITEAELYVVTVGSNDSNRMSNIGAFEKNMDILLRQLLADRTIVADIGFVGRRAPYQAVIEKTRIKYGIRGATLESSKFMYTTLREKMRFLAKDFFHPSSFGYIFWFEAFRPAIDSIIKTHNLTKP